MLLLSFHKTLGLHQPFGNHLNEVGAISNGNIVINGDNVKTQKIVIE